MAILWESDPKGGGFILDFAQLCAGGPSGYAWLRQQVDACARLGYSYEFAACRLPASCRPREARLGFWRHGDDYLLYFRPGVAYDGPDRRLRDFFGRGAVQRYAGFDALTDCLHGLNGEAAAPRPDAGQYFRLRQELEAQVLGQAEAVEAAAFKLHCHAGKREPLRPLSLIFFGPSGVGKSELGKAIAPALNRCHGEDRYRLVWTELNTFTQAHSVYRLTGAPPGYVGYDDPPVLESVRRHPHTVFMFDELDKAHPEVLKVLMSVLDEGRCTARREDEQGSRELDFRPCVFVFTTNTDLSGGRPGLGFAPPQMRREPLRPLSLIFYGPTGVGKSELGKAVAPALNRCLGEERYRLVWTELNTFTQAHSVYRLTGAPPGYVGYDDPPVLESVRRHPHTVFMFDELDKAHPEVLKVLMSVLDEGRCTARREDEQGSRELDFRPCVFVFTTNTDLSGGRPGLGFAPPQMRREPPPGRPVSLAQRLFQADEAARQALIRSGVLREIAGRFSGLIGFRPLDRKARVSITIKQIAALGREYGLNIAEVDPSLAHALTPGDALSPRSTVPMLEGLLTPVFLSAGYPGQGAVRLTGTPERPSLIPT